MFCMLQYNIIPRAMLSLKVLTELPIIVVLMLQLYKDHVSHEVVDFIPLIMDTITIQPVHKLVSKLEWIDCAIYNIKMLHLLCILLLYRTSWKVIPVQSIAHRWM